MSISPSSSCDSDRFEVLFIVSIAEAQGDGIVTGCPVCGAETASVFCRDNMVAVEKMTAMRTPDGGGLRRAMGG